MAVTTVPQNMMPIDDVISSILTFVSESESRLPNKKPLIHNAFYQLREESDLLRYIPFDTKYFPYSDIIDQVFDNIELSGMISKFNPVFKDIGLNKEALHHYYGLQIEPTFASYVPELKSLAEKFIRLVHP